MKKELFLFGVTVFTLLVLLPKAYGQQDSPGVVVYPSFSFMQEAGTLAGNQNISVIDVRAGYQISSGWYFGLIYSNTSSGGTSTLNGYGIGNSVGYFDGIFSIILSYYLSAQMSENAPSASVQRANGNGIQLDLAVNFPIAADLFIGPMLTYKDMNYSTETFFGTSQINASQTQSFIYPFVGLLYKF